MLARLSVITWLNLPKIFVQNDEFLIRDDYVLSEIPYEPFNPLFPIYIRNMEGDAYDQRTRQMCVCRIIS